MCVRVQIKGAEKRVDGGKGNASNTYMTMNVSSLPRTTLVSPYFACCFPSLLTCEEGGEGLLVNTNEN